MVASLMVSKQLPGVWHPDPEEGDLVDCLDTACQWIKATVVEVRNIAAEPSFLPPPSYQTPLALPSAVPSAVPSASLLGAVSSSSQSADGILRGMVNTAGGGDVGEGGKEGGAVAMDEEREAGSSSEVGGGSRNGVMEGWKRGRSPGSEGKSKKKKSKKKPMKGSAKKQKKAEAGVVASGGGTNGAATETSAAEAMDTIFGGDGGDGDGDGGEEGDGGERYKGEKNDLEVLRQSGHGEGGDDDEGAGAGAGAGDLSRVPALVDPLLSAAPPQPPQSVAQILIHYDGWASRWDEWIAADSPRIAPLHTYTTPSSVSAGELRRAAGGTGGGLGGVRRARRGGGAGGTGRGSALLSDSLSSAPIEWEWNDGGSGWKAYTPDVCRQLNLAAADGRMTAMITSGYGEER
jgi:hypothetical protein